MAVSKGKWGPKRFTPTANEAVDCFFLQREVYIFIFVDLNDLNFSFVESAVKKLNFSQNYF